MAYPFRLSLITSLWVGRVLRRQARLAVVIKKKHPVLMMRSYLSNHSHADNKNKSLLTSEGYL